MMAISAFTMAGMRIQVNHVTRHVLRHTSCCPAPWGRLRSCRHCTLAGFTSRWSHADLLGRRPLREQGRV